MKYVVSKVVDIFAAELQVMYLAENSRGEIISWQVIGSKIYVEVSENMGPTMFVLLKDRLSKTCPGNSIEEYGEST
jgi:hypothetical protein